jgi:tocopherol O-methyltransferase
MEEQSMSQHKVVAYYEAAGIDYKRYWFSPADPSMHFGYYDSTTRTHRASLTKMNEVLADYAAISPGNQVLDAGCGYGGSAIWLAKTKGCQVVGVTLVAEQVQMASQYARQHGVSAQVSFAQQDYTHTTFSDASFDVVWALESLVHTENKAAFFKEAFRLLRPGGYLVMAEYTLQKASLLPKQKALLRSWFDGWAMADLLPVQEYVEALQANGFLQVEWSNITPHIRPSVNRLGKLRLPVRPTSDILLMGLKFLCWMGIYNRLRMQGIEAGICMYRSLRAGLWHYTLIKARKIEKEQRT